MSTLRLKYINSIIPVFLVVRIALYIWAGIGIAGRVFGFGEDTVYFDWDSTKHFLMILFMIEAFYWNLRYRQLLEQTK